MNRIAIIAATLALSTSAHAVGYQIINGMPTFGERPKALDIFNLDWEFANDPNWQYEVFDCSLMGYVLASFQVWQTNHLPPPPVVIAPPPVVVVDNPPPPVVIDLPPPVIIPPVITPPIIIPPVVAVPEPSTWALMLIGFATLAYAGLRRRHERTTPV